MPSSTNPVPSSSALPPSNPNLIINPPVAPAMAPAPVAPVVAPTMPACNHSTAPKFKSDQPHELCRYFDKLAHLFGNCQITDTQDKKKYAIQYCYGLDWTMR
jgi:hypothetical protein